MPTERVQRRLAAILVADVVGYSLHMGRDEIGTRRRLNHIIDVIVRPALETHRGRMFKTVGDGFLSEFGSVVDAVDCAVKVQESLRLSAKGETQPLLLRIGINLGDVIIEDDDVHGDGVNVAARLEALAEPGGICISRSARDQIRDKLDYAIEDMGEVTIKNITRPVRTFRVLPEQKNAGATVTSKGRIGHGAFVNAAVALLCLGTLVGAALYWFEPWTTRVEAASAADMKLPLPDKPSVAVLPFSLASEGPDDRILADAIAEDLTRSLARTAGLFVIARSSTLDYVGDLASPARAAEDLGVRHVVRATMRRSGDRVRIDAELIDALTGRIVWSERLERASADVFDLQDSLVQALASRLSADLGRIRDQQRFTSSPDAFFLWARADQAGWTNTPAAYGQARALANEALRIDPGFVRARAALAFVETQTGYFRLAENPQGALEQALVTIQALVVKSPDDWYLQSVLAQSLLNLREYTAARDVFERAISMEPAHPNLMTTSALPLIFLGQGEAAEVRLRTAMRLNPFHNWLPNQLLGQALYLQERYQEAASSLAIAQEKNPRFIGNMWWRAATHGQLGNQAEAEQAVAEILERMPDAEISRSFIQISDEPTMERFREGLRKAGLPE